MSVEGKATILHRPTGLAPPYPQSIWYSQGAVIGDVSGGHAEVEITLNPAGVGRTGRAWSLETVLVQQAESGADAIGILLATNMDVVGPGLTNPIQKSWAVRIVGGGVNIENPDSAIDLRDAHPQIFLGSQGGTVVPAALRLQVPNVLNETTGFYATGYEWSPEGLNTGFWRPAEGMFAL